MRKFALVAFICVAAPALAQDAAPAQPSPVTALQSVAKDAGPVVVDAIEALAVVLLALLSRLAHTANQSSALGRAVTIAADYISGASKHLLEGLAPEIKADLANDGVIDAAERQHLLDKLILLVKAELPSPVQAILASGFGAGLETMLRGKIASALDAHLATVAAGPTSAVAATPEAKPAVP